MPSLQHRHIGKYSTISSETYLNHYFDNAEDGDEFSVSTVSSRNNSDINITSNITTSTDSSSTINHHYIRNDSNFNSHYSLINPNGKHHLTKFDPEESISNNEIILPPLNLMEEIVLLGLKDKQGYLSFWNDNISYVLRGCILIELALRKKIKVIDDPVRNMYDVSARIIEVVMPITKTGNHLLDEALNMMAKERPESIMNWIDLLSGETWNVFKNNLQLKNVRERVSKGLVDKGILKNNTSNFLFFDMSTHPLVDIGSKESVKQRIFSILVPKHSYLLYNNYFPENVTFKIIRSLCLICCAYGADVLDDTLLTMNYDDSDNAFKKAEKLFETISDFPINLDQREGSGVPVDIIKDLQSELLQHSGESLYLEVVAGVLQVILRMDSLL
ncbi:hypothetical protein TBLA_0A02780 [Henningerozyma blattae CBS 6284]|uniref:Vacuolar protein sorting-associated protein 74 n=1 Tax=Henningerozyma blattae (strain ATCC 34711 / CBS 6284 / DSM 70876 / NBRC 10599 / NRRL Y-10934 / UCD 77-7) TaxID=1071380 RepID=I2GVC4_HENB6|nr:hypothetical protein TBLA_0A02780 [Tetrapisispora blattae CBS 6284]CCH58076.1 hypothetical protein TBLA_0A02780 [Tetrapisispora blattae CBS 6284]